MPSENFPNRDNNPELITWPQAMKLGPNKTVKCVAKSQDHCLHEHHNNSNSATEVWMNGLSDSGEGGLFAYAIWETLPGPNDCYVDGQPMLTEANVLIGATGPLANIIIQRPNDYLQNYDEWREQYLQDLQGIGIGAFVFLGSTSQSLWQEDAGEYYTITEDNLTPKGKTIIDAISAMYGQPTYVTGLDT